MDLNIEPVPDTAAEEKELLPGGPAPAEQARPDTADIPDITTSGMERLRKRYEKLDDGVERFVVPTYGELIEGVGMVWPFLGRYRRMEPKEVRALRRECEDQEDPIEVFNIELLVRSCVELGTLGEPTVDEPEGAFVPLAPEGAEPIRWDRRLAAGLGLEPVDAPESLIGRIVMVQAFKANKQAINEHAADVYAWMMYGRAAVVAKEGEKEPGKA